MSNQSSTTSTFPLLGILGIVFIVLKLTDVIAWSWWWVLAPFWGPLALALPFLLLALVLTLAGKRLLKKAAASRNIGQQADPFAHPFFKNSI